MFVVCKKINAHIISSKNNWSCGGSNPGPFTCKANALPLSYNPIFTIRHVGYKI